MFEISKDQLRRLNDVELRELVARLCEAELSHAGAPVSAVRWGGAQTTADGGLDIDVQVEDREFQGDFVPRARTGIQVKKSKMPAGKIVKEMSPKGVLRPIFSELARHNGCYVIVSLDDDLTPGGRPLADRKKAMQAQIKAVKNPGDLRTKFYEGGDLANWLRQHPGVQLWVREKLGLPLSGWKPFGRWSTTPPDAEDGLICKEGIVIRLPGREQDKLDIPQGIDGIRELVRNSGKAVRIVGLSGVGKSRIVQALFEESVGKEPLDRHLAIYADLGEKPKPSESELVERLAAEGHPAVMVLDNCPSEVHNRLARQVASSPNLRLITIEFDIREDRPETTSVVRVDAEGPDIAETLIERWYPQLGQMNARGVAKLSGGNARLALVLADKVREEDSLSSLLDPNFFRRLFYQREAPDTDLLKAAEVLALVYSFSISPDEEGLDELATLAGLLDQSRLALHRAAQTLIDRQLAQKRGRWRAVLPDAVANWLAERALRNIPVHDILDTFQGLQSPRMLKSFGKRLGYLHLHEVAQDIVKSWLSNGGLLHNVSRLNDEGITLLCNVAPVVPEGVLDAIEAQNAEAIGGTFFSRQNPHCSTIADLLVSIAYDPDLFERCVTLLAKFALMEQEEGKEDNIQDRLFYLFSLYLSGTEASPDTRENLARRFLLSDFPNEQQLGLGMLSAALESLHWDSTGSFGFGARPRDLGYAPKTQAEFNQWLIRFIELAQEIATGNNTRLSTQARNLLADEFHALWRHPGLRATLAGLAKDLNDQRPWLEGWQAIREIKHYNIRKANGKATPEGAELLDELDDLLKPKQLSDEIRAYVLNAGYELFDEESSRKRIAYELGTAAIGEPLVIDELLQDFFTARVGCLVEFGKGLALTCRDLRALWNRLVEGLELAGDQARHCGVLEGVLKVIHQHSEPLTQKILDEAVQNRLLRKFIVDLHLSVSLDHSGVARLCRSLGFEDIPLRQFEKLAWHRLPDIFDETNIRDLMLAMLDKAAGARIVLEGLRLRTLNEHGITLSPALKRVGLLAFAAMLQGTTIRDSNDYRLPDVLAFCLDETELPEETDAVFHEFLARVRGSVVWVAVLETSAAALAEEATFRFLDGMFLDPDLTPAHRRRVFAEGDYRKSPLSGVRVGALLDWCRQGDFQARLVMISEAIYPFEERQEGNRVVLSEQAHAIIDASQDPSTVLRNLGFSACRPSGGWGSLADIIAKRRRAFETLLEHDRPDVRAAAAVQIAEIKNREEHQRRYEQESDRQYEQRFEW